MSSNQTNEQSIVKGAMILSLSIILTKIIGILYRIPVTNALGDIGNGIYSVAYQVYIIIITLTSIGLPSAISKLVSERRAVGDYKAAHQVYKIAMWYSIGLAIILSTALWFGADNAAMIFQEPRAASAIEALVPAVIIVTIMAVMKGYFQGMQSMTPTAIAQVIEQVVHAVVSIVLAHFFLQIGLEEAVVGSTLGVAIGAMAGVLFLLFVYLLLRSTIYKKIRKSSEVFHETKGEILKQILVTSVPIMLSASVFSIMTTIDYSMIGQILPNTIEEIRAAGDIALLPVSPGVLNDTQMITTSLTGIFSLKYITLLNLPVSLILTLGMAATPAIAASMARADYKDVKRKVNMIIKIGMIFAAPAAIGLTLFGEEIIMFLLPREPYGGELLAQGGIAIIFITIAQLSAGILQGMGKQRIPTMNAVIACSIKVVFNIIFLHNPAIHIYGVIHSTTICYIIYALLNMAYLVRFIGMRLNYVNLFIKPMAIACIMGVSAKGIYTMLYQSTPLLHVWLVLSIILAMIIYGLLGLMTGTINKYDLQSVPGGYKIIMILERLNIIK